MSSNTITIVIPEDEARQLESACYEAKARKDLMAFLIEQGADTSGQAFIDCKREYVKFGIEWNKAQDALEQKYLAKYPGRKKWWLENNTCNLNVIVDAE